MRRFPVLICLVATSAASALADDAGAVTLFGQKYKVTRFDYTYVTLQDPNSPFGEGVMVEVEGVYDLGDNRILMSTDEMDAWGMTKNFIVELSFNPSGSETDGFSLTRVIATQDELREGWDLDPSGLSINTGDNGLGAGGNILVSNSQTERTMAYTLDTGDLMEFPVGSGCLDEDNGRRCGWNVDPINANYEDLTYVPSRDQVYTVDQTGPFEVDVFEIDGDYVSTFEVGQGSTGAPKGITFLPESKAYPALFKGKGGVILVALDDDGPGLQAFDLDGNEIKLEHLDNGSGEAPWDTGDCSNALQIESVTSDPKTGRIMLVQQSDFLDCGKVYVLTPVKKGDMNCDGSVDFDDIDPFVLALTSPAEYQAAYPNCDILNGDFDEGGDVNFDDIDAFVDALLG